jgi:predicted secreted protein
MNRSLQFTLAVIIAIFAAAASATAGDYAHLNFIGFSKDGRYLAFEEYGVSDGSGFPYASIYFIDTAKNTYAAPPVTARIESETATEASVRSRVLVQADKKLKQFAIVKGNTGKHVVSHKINDLTLDETENIIRFAEEIDSNYRRGVHELALRSIPVSPKECEAYSIETVMLQLTLANKDDETSKVLQKDTSLPQSRGCVLSYRVQDVYLYKDFAAVFINVYTPGFEGQDMRFMAVTGAIR